MPHGYLKNSKEVSRKKARGGASFSNKKSHRGIEKDENENVADDGMNGSTTRMTDDSKKRQKQKKMDHLMKKCRKNRYNTSVGDIEFYIPRIPVKDQHPYSKRSEESILYPTSECIICFENRPIISLSKKCTWHGGACFSCLRRLCIKDAQKDVKNFPISCFHPQCRRQIHFAQLQKHNLFSMPEEIMKHYEMTVRAKIKRSKILCTVLCPKCDMPRAIHGVPKQDKILTCKQCISPSVVTPDYTTIVALGKIKKDKIGRNDGCARCPNCSILISKGDGCDDMFCPYCLFNFSWEDAVDEFNALPIAKPPADEIYLWW